MGGCSFAVTVNFVGRGIFAEPVSFVGGGSFAVSVNCVGGGSFPELSVLLEVAVLQNYYYFFL